MPSLLLQELDHGKVHPHKGNGGEDEEHEEGHLGEACPGLGVGEEGREEEAAQGPQHPHQSSHRPHVPREVGGDVLVDGGLADALANSDEEDQGCEEPDVHGELHDLLGPTLGVENDVPFGHHEYCSGQADEGEGPVHDPSRPEAVG